MRKVEIEVYQIDELKDYAQDKAINFFKTMHFFNEQDFFEEYLKTWEEKYGIYVEKIPRTKEHFVRFYDKHACVYQSRVVSYDKLIQHLKKQYKETSDIEQIFSFVEFKEDPIIEIYDDEKHVSGYRMSVNGDDLLGKHVRILKVFLRDITRKFYEDFQEAKEDFDRTLIEKIKEKNLEFFEDGKCYTKINFKYF